MLSHLHNFQVVNMVIEIQQALRNSKFVQIACKLCNHKSGFTMTSSIILKVSNLKDHCIECSLWMKLQVVPCLFHFIYIEGTIRCLFYFSLCVLLPSYTRTTRVLPTPSRSGQSFSHCSQPHPFPAIFFICSMGFLLMFLLVTNIVTIP